jgi:hypothetical protein
LQCPAITIASWLGAKRATPSTPTLSFLKRKKYLVNIFVAVSAFAGGAIYGFREGMNNYYHLDAMPEAAIGTIYYKQLGEGDFKKAQGYYDMQVDREIDGYIWYQENGNPVLSNIFLREHINGMEEYLAKLIKFRKQVPAADIGRFLEGDAKTDYVSRAGKRDALLSSQNFDAKP